jgi:hypothetical protein
MRVALILVGLSMLAVMELKAPQRTTKPVSEPPAQAAVGSYDTLTTADRLEVPHMLETPPQPTSSGEVMPPTDQISILAQEPSKIVEGMINRTPARDRPGAVGMRRGSLQLERSARGVKSAVVLPRARPERGISKAAAKLNPAKPVAEVKPCPSGVFDSLIRALNLPTRCQT